MFFCLLLSTVLGVLFVFCGLLGAVDFFINAQTGMSIGAFVQGFAVSVWPLLAGCVLFLLLQMLKELEALREKGENQAASAPVPQTAAQAPAPKAAPAPLTEEDWAPKATAAPVYFPVRETPLGPRILRLAEEKAAAERAATRQEDDSAEEQTDAEMAPEEISVEAQPEELPAAPEPPEPVDDGRTFFKTR